MLETVNTHPTLEQLAAYDRGELTPGEQTTIDEHLSLCKECCARCAELPPDSFVRKVVDALASKSAVPETDYGKNSESVLARARQQCEALPDAPAELLRSTKYRILGKLGQGGMGVVYKAEQIELSRKVVIKVVSPKLARDPEVLARFAAEARAAAQLDHENLVPVFDIDREGDLRFFVMAYVDGISLDKLVELKGTQPVREACHFIRQAALGLQHAHEKGMVHRDIKPQNLMVTRKYVAKILDFGLARVPREIKGDGAKTVTHTFMGTPAYAAPEQFNDSSSVDIRADVYSLGCTLFFLLTGRPPFEKTVFMEYLIAHASEELPRLTDLRPDAPPELAEVVAKMMAKKPEDRYQTPAEVAQALAPFLAAPKQEAPADEGFRLVAKSALPGGETVRPKQRAEDTHIAPDSKASRRPAEPSQARKSRVQEQPAESKKRRPMWPLLAGVGAVVAFAAVAIFVLILQTKEGKVVVEVEQAGAELTLNGEKLSFVVAGEKKPIEIKPKEGENILEVTKDGFTTQTKTFSYRKGDNLVFKVSLEQAGKEPIAKPGARFGAREGKAGTWRVEGNSLIKNARGEHAFLYFGERDWTDYVFSVEAEMISGNDGFVLYFRKHELTSHYRWAIGDARNKTIALGEYEEGRGGEMLGGELLGRPFSGWKPFAKGLLRNVWYTATVRVQGDQCLCYLNGIKAFPTPYVEIPDRLKGGVGIGVWNAPYRFRNIRVTSLDGKKVLLEGLPDLPDR